MKTLFVRNLPFNASEAELRKAFEAFGPVHRCSIAKNRDTGESRGFGLVDMEDDAAGKAIVEMNGKMFANRTIVVQESDPKTRGAAGGGAPGGAGRPPMGGARPGGYGQGAPSRPQSSGAPFRSDGMSRSAPSRPSPPLNRNFGPPASPAAERNRVYKDKKDDRLKPYKRDQFDFRSALDDEEENRAGRKDKDGDDTTGGE
jgi:RNA recognition motif-containing protein